MARDGTVLVVGAGAAGLCAAVELTRRGIAVRVIDERSGPPSPGRTDVLALLPTTLAILAASGIADPLGRKGRKIGHVEVRWQGRLASRIDLAASGAAYPYILILARSDLEQAMMDWLRGHGVSIEWKLGLCEIVATHQPTVVLSNKERFETAAVLGCDGNRGAVREAIDAVWTAKSRSLVASCGEKPSREAFERPLAIIDFTGEGTLRTFLPVSADAARLDELAQGSTRKVSGGTPPGPANHRALSHDGPFGRVQRMAMGKVFLAGGEACSIPSLGERGVNLCLWEAANFAYLFSLTRETEYEMRSRPTIDRVFEQLETAARFAAEPPFWASAFMRFVLPAAVHVPVLRRKIVRRILALDLPQPEWLQERPRS